MAPVWDVAHQWLTAYTYAVDTADLDALARLCTDVTVGTPNGQTASGEALADIYRSLVVAPDEAGRLRSKHHISNLDVKLLSEDHAVSRAYYLVLSEFDGAPAIASTGRYVGKLARQEGTWVVTTHTVVRDLARSTPLASTSGTGG